MVIKVEVDCKLVQGAYAQEISPLLDNIPIGPSKVVLKIGEFFYCIFKWCVCSANSNWSSRRVESCGSSEFEGGRWLRFSGSDGRIELVVWFFGCLVFWLLGFLAFGRCLRFINLAAITIMGKLTMASWTWQETKWSSAAFARQSIYFKQRLLCEFRYEVINYSILSQT